MNVEGKVKEENGTGSFKWICTNPNLSRFLLSGNPDNINYTWTYDALHRITAFTTPDGTATYTYDDTSQLTAADYDYQSGDTYTYDANNNRTIAG